MKRKSIFSKIVMAILAVVMVASLVGCKDPAKPVEKKDPIEVDVVLDKVLNGIYKLLDGAAGADGNKINMDITIGVNIDIQGTKIPADLRIALYAQEQEKAEMLVKLTDGNRTLLGIYSKDDVAYIEDGLTNATVTTFKVDASEFTYSDYLDDLPKIVKNLFRKKTDVAGVYKTDKKDVFAVQGGTKNDNIIRAAGADIAAEDADKYYAASAKSYKEYIIQIDNDQKLIEAKEPVKLANGRWEANSYKLKSGGNGEKILVTGETKVWVGSANDTFVVEGDGDKNGEAGKFYIAKASNRTDYTLTSGEATPVYFENGKDFFQGMLGDISGTLSIVGGLLAAETTATKSADGVWGAGDYNLTLVTKGLAGLSTMLKGVLEGMSGSIKGVLDTLLPYVLGASFDELIAASDAANAGDSTLLDAIKFPSISISSSFDAAGMITSLGLKYENEDPKTDATIGLVIKDVVINTTKPTTSLIPDSIIDAAKEPVVEVGVKLDIGDSGLSNFFDVEGKLYIDPAKVSVGEVQAVVIATAKDGKAIELAGQYYYDTTSKKEYLLFDIGYLYTVLGLTPSVSTVYSYRIYLFTDKPEAPVDKPVVKPEEKPEDKPVDPEGHIKKPGNILDAVLGSLKSIVDLLPNMINTADKGQVGINIDGTAIMNLLFGMNVLNGTKLELIPEDEKVKGEEFTHRYEKIDKTWILNIIRNEIAPNETTDAAKEAKVKELVKELTGIDFGTASLSDILFGEAKTNGIYIEMVIAKPTADKNGINVTLKIKMGTQVVVDMTANIQIKDASTVTIPSTNIDVTEALKNELGAKDGVMLDGSAQITKEWESVLKPALDAILKIN